MNPYNVDCLRQDEIIFELRVRNVDPDPNLLCPELRKKLRKLIRNKAVANLQYLPDKIKIVDEVDLCIKKTAEFNSLVEGLTDTSPALHKARLQSRLYHLLFRITCLSKLELSGKARESLTKAKTDVESRILPTVNALIEAIGKEQVASELRKLSLECEEEESKIGDGGPDDVFSPAEKESPTHSLASAANTSESASEIDKTTTHLVDTTLHTNLVIMNPEKSTVVNTSLRTNSLPVNKVADSIFAKLRNPVESYVRELRSCDGLEVNALLHFIKTMLHIRKGSDLSDSEIFEILSVYATGPLLNRIRSNKLFKPDVNHLHRDLIRYFLPQSLRENLIRDRVTRVQKYMEPLLGYVASVIEHAEILVCDYSEKQVVDILILGLHPTVRSRLVFHSMPRNLEEFYQLCIHEQNIRYNDNQRGAHSSAPGRGHQPIRATPRFQPHPNFNIRDDRDQATEPMSGNPHRERREPRCYQCNGTGHFARQCPDQ